MKTILPEHIENILGFNINNILRKRILDFDLNYRDLTKEERDNYILSVINILNKEIVYSGKHRIDDWEKGWKENLEMFKDSKKIEFLIPKYHGKHKISRWNGDVVMPLVDSFDYKIHICMVDAILQHYLKDCDNIYEFGCGPAYHLIRLNDFNKNIKLHGTDWTKSSQDIIKEINNILNIKIDGFNLDFFKPNYDINLDKNSGIYTVAALEQVGENFKPFIDFLLEKKPNICIHIEPIDELLDENKLIDKLSIMYFRKRKYLNGFLPYLEKLQSENKIEIIKKQRIYSGSYFIEGHSLIVWKIK